MNLISTYRFYVVALCTLLCANLSFSQDDECGNRTNENEYLQYFKSIKSKSNGLEQKFLNDYNRFARNFSNLTSVPIKPHIIRNTNGSGGLSEGDLNDAIAIMNSYFANAGLEFFICGGINYVDNSNFYSLESNEESSLTSANNVDDVINIYFTDTVYSSSGSSLCGYAYYPGGPETIVMANGCATNGSTLAHEMGHFFGLFHTHGNSNTPGSTNELVNGSNCDSSGDYVCDTPADPVLSSSLVSSSCNYTGNATDANNDTYVPDPNNIMSYSRKSCRTLFSDEQYARINSTYQLSRSNLKCPDFNVDFVADITESCDANLTVNFTESSEGATGWSWDIDGDGFEDYNQRNITHTYYNPGDFDVTLTISNGDDTISMVKYNYIDVGADEIDTDEITLILKLDNWPSETTWQFTDSNGTLVASGGPYQEGVDDGATKTETFSIDSDLCYNFEIYDIYGDGICCTAGSGSYELRDANNTLLASGGDFGSVSSDNFFNGNLLSVNEISKEQISLYPNPAIDEINITVSNGLLPESIIIFNAFGQQLVRKEISSQHDLKVKTQDFDSGLYILKLQNESSEVSLPFIKQ